MLRLPAAGRVCTYACNCLGKLARAYALKFSATLGIEFVQLQRTFPSLNNSRGFLRSLGHARSRKHLALVFLTREPIVSPAYWHVDSPGTSLASTLAHIKL